jgi:hypothetical protein
MLEVFCLLGLSFASITQNELLSNQAGLSWVYTGNEEPKVFKTSTIHTALKDAMRVTMTLCVLYWVCGRKKATDTGVTLSNDRLVYKLMLLPDYL